MMCRHYRVDDDLSGLGQFPKCAFDAKGKFHNDNWNCKLMNELRELVSPLGGRFPYAFNEDQYCGIIPFSSCRFAILSWYKDRGHTEQFHILQFNKIRPGTEKDAKEIAIEYKVKK